MIEIKALRFQYPSGPFVLRVPELGISRGEKVAIIGPSGSGKTTLVCLMSGILVPQTGVVRVCDVDLAQRSDAERRDFRISRVGFVFQEFGLLDYLVVRENILLPYYVNPSLTMDKEAEARAESLADSLGLADDLARRPGGLSHGQRQRVAICRALVTWPELLIADEPTGNLDPRTADTTLALLLELVAQHNMTMLMVTHNHSLLDRLDRVVDVGRFVEGSES